MSPSVSWRRTLAGAIPGGIALLALGALATAWGSPSPPTASSRPATPSVPPTSVPVTSVAPTTSVSETSVPVTSVSPTDIPTDTLLASRTAQGGRCVNGLCERRYRVYVDGRWDYVANTRSSEGHLSPDDLAALQAAVDTTRILDADPFTGLCPTAWDGSEIVYVWFDDDGRHEESTCTREIPDTDPLVEVLERLVADA